MDSLKLLQNQICGHTWSQNLNTHYSFFTNKLWFPRERTKQVRREMSLVLLTETDVNMVIIQSNQSPEIRKKKSFFLAAIT